MGVWIIKGITNDDIKQLKSNYLFSFNAVEYVLLTQSKNAASNLIQH
jgi:hypothetical protein